MIEGCPETVKEIIQRESKWFEEKVLGCLAQDLSLYKLARNIVCRDPARDGEYTQDFENRFLNPAYEAVAAYNDMFVDTPPEKFRPISIDFARVWLKQKSDSGELLSINDLEEVLKALEKAVTTTILQDSLPTVKLGLATWLKFRKADQVSHHFKMEGNTSIDALSLELEYNLNAIREIENDGVSSFADMPDRFTMKGVAALGDLKPDSAQAVDVILNVAKNELRQIRPPGQPLKSQVLKLNDALGGGFYRGDAYLFIAPTGAGKTVCACQLAMNFMGFSGASNSSLKSMCEAATKNNKKNKGIFITTEEPHERLLPRMVSQVCNIPITAVRDGIDPSRMDAMQRQDLADWYLNMEGLMIANWTKKMNVSLATELPEEIEKFREEYDGDMPDFVILDWIGGALGENATTDQIRLIYQNTADNFEKMAKKYRFVAVAFAQASASGMNRKKVDSTQIAECKTMGRNYTGIIGITNLEDQAAADASDDGQSGGAELRREQQYFWVSKSRVGKDMGIPFKRQYLYQRQANWV